MGRRQASTGANGFSEPSIVPFPCPSRSTPTASRPSIATEFSPFSYPEPKATNPAPSKSNNYLIGEFAMATQQELQVQPKREVEKKQERTVPSAAYLPATDIFETDQTLTV